MDYFNFEEASNTLPHLDLDMPSTEADLTCPNPEVDADAHGNYPNPFVNNKRYGQTIKLRFINDRIVEGILWDHHDGTDFPMYRAKEACALCAKMGLDCFVSSRGALITGCTCCISLFRQCSFTHNTPPKGYVPTMSGIAEDTQQCQGKTLESRPPMKSYEEAKGRKTGARFPRDAVKILKRWLTEHADHPYPSEREKEELKQLTGLKKTQIANWLANARRRGKVRPASGPSSPMLGAIDIPGNVNFADLNPMDRWKASPPENEPANMTDIARAISTVPQPHSGSNSHASLQNSRASSRKASSEDDSNWSVFRAPTVSSFGTKESSNSDFSFASSHSQHSKVSKVSQASSQERRRRRRAPMTQRAVAQATKSRSARIFQCTFCTDAFPSKYDWQRHEKSLHLALERWICCPTGGVIELSGTAQKRCAFCPEIEPSEAHLETHNFSSCYEKSIQERTFYRKDHLRQHMKLTHETKFNPAMEAWKSATTEIKSRCGFCTETFTTWQQRVDHLTAHFRSGADMCNWSGDWGFDPEIEKCVENAIPPYLIGTDRASVNPYVARVARGQSGASNERSPVSPSHPGLSHGSSPAEEFIADDMEAITADTDSLSWIRFERDNLAKYVLGRQNQGIILSDKEIQDYARASIYGSADPLDWTFADNAEWLNAFKGRIGFNNLSGSVSTGVHPSGRSSRGPQTPAHSDFGFPVLAGEDFDNNMQLDFDAADFASLNIDELGDLNLDVPAASFDGVGDISMPYAPVQKQPAGQGMFDHFDMSLDMPVDGMTVGSPGMDTMSAHDLEQLTQYMAGFSAKKF